MAVAERQILFLVFHPAVFASDLRKNILFLIGIAFIIRHFFYCFYNGNTEKNKAEERKSLSIFFSSFNLVNLAKICQYFFVNLKYANLEILEFSSCFAIVYSRKAYSANASFLSFSFADVDI